MANRCRHSYAPCRLSLTTDSCKLRVHLPPSTAGKALNWELLLKQNSLLSQPGEFQNSNQLPAKKTQPYFNRRLKLTEHARIVRLKVNRAADIIVPKMSDAEDIEDILIL